MRINLLGSCQVVWQGLPLTILRRQTRALLYLLAARLEPIPRARIAFLFWPDMSDAIARRHLTRLLSGLRAVLPLPNLLLADEEGVALNPALVQSDSQQLAAASVSGDLTVLEAAVACYRGPFMAGFSLPNAPEYEIWQMQTARHLDAHYLTLLEQLAVRYASAGDLPAAYPCCSALSRHRRAGRSYALFITASPGVFTVGANPTTVQLGVGVELPPAAGNQYVVGVVRYQQGEAFVPIAGARVIYYAPVNGSCNVANPTIQYDQYTGLDGGYGSQGAGGCLKVVDGAWL
ncbi:hypothetical protein [Caldilinea sp.]|jgi:hypothetical protein|uniref:AfsR/SARP family transcriptional regulator n=1 Tax=Caldilinea sp. TaxID=2293560 RepID=UPI001B250257|nr:hypothetical protein [Caldilinea sp.]MBO9393017.1 hypothetical protein [Caldilinea sp.]